MNAESAEVIRALFGHLHNAGDGGVWESFDRENAQTVAESLTPLVRQLMAQAWDEGATKRADYVPGCSIAHLNPYAKEADHD